MTSNLHRQALLNAIQQEIQRGRPQRAQQLLLRLLKQEPDNQDAWLRLADTFDDPAKAVRALEQLLKLNPQHAVAKKRLADLQELETVTQLRQAQAAAENGRSLPKITWLLVPMLIGFLAGASYLGWVILNAGEDFPLQIERSGTEAADDPQLAYMTLEEGWDCIYQENTDLTQFYGRLHNRHPTATLRSYTLRVALLAEDLQEVSSNLSQETGLIILPGETADFSISVFNPTGSDICLIERLDATFHE